MPLFPSYPGAPADPSPEDARPTLPASGPTPATLGSYGGLFESRSAIHFPRSIEEIVALYDRTRQAGTTLAFRGEGLSFHTQGLDCGTLVSLARFASIEVDVVRRQVTVGAGATWGDILAATEPHGLVPAVMVSTSHATAGGTLSACCMSRFSPAAGKEGEWVASFTIVTPDGAVRHCSRTEHTDLFVAAIGGFGYFGAVTSITYELLHVGTPARIKTVVTRKPDASELHARLVPPSDSSPSRTTYSVFAIANDTVRTMYCESSYCNEAELTPMMPHRPMLWSRVLTELMVQWVPALGQLFWNYAYEVYIRLNDTYVDSTHGYTFFMDGNVRAKRLGKKLGMRFRAVQQTFVIPRGEAALDAFLRACVEGMKAAGTPPAMIDALFLEADETGFLLSSTRGLAGYAVSVAFESLTDDKVVGVTRCLEELSRICGTMGGRVHLTKNVFARPEDVRAMYADALPSLFAAKEKYDPDRLLANRFLERLFIAPGPAAVGDGARAEDLAGAASASTCRSPNVPRGPLWAKRNRGMTGSERTSVK